MKFHLHPQFTREYWQRENSLVYMSDRNDFTSLFYRCRCRRLERKRIKNGTDRSVPDQSRLGGLRLVALDGQRYTHTTTNTERCQPLLGVAFFHLVEQGD